MYSTTFENRYRAFEANTALGITSLQYYCNNKQSAKRYYLGNNWKN